MEMIRLQSGDRALYIALIEGVKYEAYKEGGERMRTINVPHGNWRDKANACPTFHVTSAEYRRLCAEFNKPA